MMTCLSSVIALLALILSVADAASQRLALERYQYEFTAYLKGAYQGNDHGRSYSGGIDGLTAFVDDDELPDRAEFIVTVGTQDTLRIAYGIKLVHARSSKEILELIVEDPDRPIIFDVSADRVILAPGRLTFVPQVELNWLGLLRTMKGSGHYYEEFLDRAEVIDSLPRTLTLTFKEVNASTVEAGAGSSQPLVQAGNSLRFKTEEKSGILEIYDCIGRNRHEVLIEPQQTEVSIPSGLEPGVYFAKLRDEKCKLVINK